MLKKMALGLVLLIIFVIAGCSDDDPTPDVDGFTVEQFPVEVGNWWKYEVLDTLYGMTGGFTVQVDTVTLTAAETLFVDCTGGDCLGTYIRFEINDGDTQWEALLVVDGDTVTYNLLRFIADEFASAILWSGFRWHFPLEIGKTWKVNPNFSDEISVIDREYVKLHQLGFGSAYLLHRDWTMPNAGGISDVWVVPYVGIVKHYSYSYCTVCDPGPPSSTWTLIDWFGYYDPNK